VGAALGFVYAPCAGPILAAVIAVGAASSRTVPVGLSFALGSALVLLVLSLGGRALAGRVRTAGRGPGLQRALAGVLVLTGIAMAANLDVRFQSAIADHLPAALVNPTHGLETSRAVSSRLDDLRGPSRFAVAATGRKSVAGARLPRLGAAPDFIGNQRWFNTPGGQPLSLKALRGKVVLVDFWTYTCINCLRTLPYLEAWDARYRGDGLAIVGVHSPEFPFEREAGNVSAAIRREGIKYAVAQDNELKTWDAWGNQYWPAEYLIDARGQVRDAHFGEGEYDRTEMNIRALLKEAGHPNPGAMADPKTTVHPTREATPETYLGLARAERFDPPPLQGTHTYAPPSKLATSHFALSGTWEESAVAATARAGAAIHAAIVGKDAYLVLSPPQRGSGEVTVLLDGHPIAANRAGADVHRGVVRVDRQRLYHLVSAPTGERHALTLRVTPGVQAYAFTFG
jgi:thiol-disulfide isomerase/thioredoxin